MEKVALQLVTILEAIFFVSEVPLSIKDLENIVSHQVFNHLEITPELLKTSIQLLKERYAHDIYAYELRKVGDGYQLLTKKTFADYVRAVVVSKEKKKLTKAALECLAVVAYRQPVTRAEIEFIRGVSSDYAIHKLLDNQLIEIAGRADLPGKPIQYRTSQYFMEYFKINNLSDLPTLEELKADEELIGEEFKNFLQNQPLSKLDETSEN